MNKYLYAGVAVLVVVVAAFALMGNKSQTSVSIPTISSTPSVSPQATTSQNTVTLTSAGFTPQTLTVKTGTTVTWVNKSGAAAAIDSDPHPIHTSYPPLNLGSVPDNGTVSLTFDKTGTYTYHNHLNPSQKGTVVAK